MKTSLLIALSLVIAACGAGGPDDAREREETVGSEIARDYNRAMDKAHNVEALSFEQKDRMDAALQEAEGANKKP